jgi:hypothetical protein
MAVKFFTTFGHGFKIPVSETKKSLMMFEAAAQINQTYQLQIELNIYFKIHFFILKYIFYYLK